MIVQVAGHGVLIGIDTSVGIDAVHAETGVGGQPVFAEIELMFDEERTRESVIAHAISANPGVHERQRQHKKDN
jgi:hypothetical protein